MTTLVRLAKRAGGLTPEQFHAEHSGPDGWSLVDGLRRATRSMTLIGAYRRGEPVFDVVDELVFDDEVTARATLEDPRFLARWSGDGVRPGSIVTLVVDEHVAKPGDRSTTTVKNFEFVTRRPDLSRSEFRRYWVEEHGPLAAQIEPIRHYVQSHVTESSYLSGPAPGFDGLALTWFDDTAAMRRSGETPEYARTRADEPNFLAGELPFIITTERTVS